MIYTSFIIDKTWLKVASLASEGEVGEDGMTKEERDKQRKRKAAERLREINKRKKMERVNQQKELIVKPSMACVFVSFAVG